MKNRRFSVVPPGLKNVDALRPGSELPGYFQVSLRDKTLPGQDAVLPKSLRPGSELPGYFQVSLRDKKVPGQDAVFRSPGRDEV
ncbi:hypothetical protein QUF80_13755 [Desulfococcaceae bacterium HSG8]|nr:hypothetical protein [Desulfococcaceae bacterium HSG8]